NDIMLITESAEILKVSGQGRDATHISCYRFENDGGYLILIFRDEFFDTLNVVVWRDQRVFGCAPGNARAIRRPEGQRSASGGDQKRIAMPVIAALHLNELVFPGIASRQTYRRHGGFCSGIDHPHLFY